MLDFWPTQLKYDKFDRRIRYYFDLRSYQKLQGLSNLLWSLS